MAIPVTYFSVIQLKHRGTNRYLCSLPKKYDHKGCSPDQFIVGTEETPSDRSQWLVRPMHLCDYQRKAGEQVGWGQHIRLENVVMGTNLHSHTRPAPHSGNQSEVTTFGAEGFCNEDDNWRFTAPEQQVGNIADGVQVELIHLTTGLRLHSHETKLSVEESLNEVTGFPNRDGNDVWIVDAVLPPPEKIALHPYAKFKINETEIVFETPKKIQEWLIHQCAQTNWAWQTPANRINNNLKSIDGIYNTLIATVQTAVNAEQNPSQFYSATKELQRAFETTYSTKQLLRVEDPKFQFVLKKKIDSPEFAAAILAHFCSLPISDYRSEVKPSFEAIAFEYGLEERSTAEIAALGHIQASFEGKCNERVTEMDAMLLRMQTAFEIAENKIKQNDVAYQKVFEDGNKEMEGTKKAFQQEFALKASVDYWNKKIQYHSDMSVKFAKAAMTLAAISISVLCYEITKLLESAGINPPWWKLGVLLILATFSIWMVRIVVQIMQSHIHLESDARERVTMIQTYLAMLKETVAPKEDHKLLILQTLFRPASSGIIKDDGAPATWLEIMVSKLMTK